MALLSDATVVVEASNSSGTRFQALEALRLGRRLFLLESLALAKEVVWAQEVLRLGAEVLTRENAGELLGSLGPSRLRVG
jgi:DNA processing protein